MANIEKDRCRQPPTAIIQTYIAIISFVVAVAFAIAGFVTPPQGQLHDSNLYLVAQFLLVTTSIFGVSAVVTHGRWKIEAR